MLEKDLAMLRSSVVAASVELGMTATPVAVNIHTREREGLGSWAALSLPFLFLS